MRRSTASDLAKVDGMFARERRAYRFRVQSALLRARAHGGAGAAEPIGDDRYRVAGLRGSYFVALFGPESSRCTCKAGTFGDPCYHAACAWLRRLADNSVATKRAPSVACDDDFADLEAAICRVS